MSSPGIDLWIKKAPESWAKLAKNANKKTSYENFKKKFFEGAELENKSYLKKYLDDSQLRNIYEQGAGGQKQERVQVIETKSTRPEKIVVFRKGNTYTRSNSKRWGFETKFVLSLASKEKAGTKKYEELVNTLINMGRTRQAVVKKIQRTRKGEKL